MKKVLVLLIVLMLIPFAYATEFESFDSFEGFEGFGEFEDFVEYSGDEFLADADEASFEIWDGEEAIGFMPDEEGGYNGEWMQLEGLNMEFCLPDGWKIALTEEEKIIFYGEKEDQTASISIYVESERVNDIFAWGDKNLAEYEIDTASFYDVVIKETEGQTAVYLINAEGKLVAFRFNYDENALDREMILEIVGTAYDVWA